MKQVSRLEKAYDLIASNADIMSIDDILELAKIKIKGLNDIEFYAALELDNENRTADIQKLLTKVGY